MSLPTSHNKTVASALALAVFAAAGSAMAEEKSKFYDFSDQLIDGEIKKPTTLVLDVRQRAKFDKLLKLKKSFRPALLDTAKERLLK
ncbi:MAG: hypothetical protein FJ100_02550 [Deltaproteobacteria bacterium]|nr:hypothetical protein [Deltaproteobacteria bacterium]